MFNLNQLVEVRLKNPEDFLKIKETLSRIGLASKKENTLYQSCHILHKQGKYYIVHFKELFLLDGKDSTLAEGDLARRNRIVNLLEEWELLDIVNIEQTKDLICPLNQIKIIAFKDKNQWNLVTKYTIGNKY
jgi:hypothetical protein